jgi:hypothetical protein
VSRPRQQIDNFFAGNPMFCHKLKGRLVPVDRLRFTTSQALCLNQLG